MGFLTNEVIVFQILYIIGISSESMSGTIAAVRKNMDFFGVITIATITALGGGTVRDVLLGNYPLTWVLYPGYILITLLASVVAIFVIYHIVKLRKLFLILDALGLVTFAYLGSGIGYTVALEVVGPSGFQVFGAMIIAVIMAIITGASGGILRDILCNDIPLVFQAELYAIVAAIVGVLHAITLFFMVDYLITALIIVIIGLVIRLYAIFRNWHLPKFKYFG